MTFSQLANYTQLHADGQTDEQTDGLQHCFYHATAKLPSVDVDRQRRIDDPLQPALRFGPV